MTDPMDIENLAKAASEQLKEVLSQDIIVQQQARIKELESTLRKLEQWFDTDQEILDVMGNNEKADHMRKLKLIRDTLTGGKDDY